MSKTYKDNKSKKYSSKDKFDSYFNRKKKEQNSRKGRRTKNDVDNFYGDDLSKYR